MSQNSTFAHAAPATRNDGGGLQGAAPATKIATQLGFHLGFHLKILWVSRGVSFGSHLKFHLRVSYEDFYQNVQTFMWDMLVFLQGCTWGFFMIL